MNNVIAFYKKEIDRYKYMSEICIKLLEFNDNTEEKQNKISKLKDEIINHSNYNRVNRINKEIDKAKEFHANGKTWDIALKEAGVDISSEEYKKHISRLRNIGPKKYLKECINEIIKCQQFIKEEKKSQKEHSKNRNRIKTNKKVKNNIPIRKEETLDDIIKKHVIESNIFIESKEIEEIKEEFGLTLLNAKHDYLSEKTMEQLFALRIVTELLDRHEEVAVNSILTTMDSLFDLAINEISYRRNSTPFGGKNAIKYESVLDRIKYTNRDFVEEYTILYEKVIKYLGKLSKEERQEFNDKLKSAHNIQDDGYLILPETFRRKVNERSKEKVNRLKLYAVSEPHNAYRELSHYTKYMKAEEIANYYHEIKETKTGYNQETLQRVFALLIESRMKPIDTGLNKQEQKTIKDRRIKAITDEYLDGEFLYIDRDDIEKDYATKRVQSRETIEKSKKRYFRMSKFKQAIELMDFKKLQKLSDKEVLKEEEIQRVKKMF